MKNTCAFTTGKIFIHTIILGIVASFSHFAYDLSGKNVIVGIFNPVNESVWEHLKFMFFPFLLWWIVMYFIKSKKCKIPLNTWIVSAAVSLVTAPLSVVLLFYSYTGALGIESVIIDILLVFVCYFVALCVASHFLKYSEPSEQVVIISVIVIALIFMARCYPSNIVQLNKTLARAIKYFIFISVMCKERCQTFKSVFLEKGTIILQK